uniref:Major sperm protein n=1 Tax=Panagrellus redivivus TaxID=6233 RepID=A0A7E4WDN6_PANRE
MKDATPEPPATTADQVMDPLYEGELVDQSIDGPPPTAEVITGKTLMAGLHSLNRKWLTVDPVMLKLNPGTPSIATLTNDTDSKLAFKITLPMYPHLTVSPLSGFIMPKKTAAFSFLHKLLARHEVYGTGKLPTIKIVACEVPPTFTVDTNLDDFFISLNGCAQMSCWVNVPLEMVVDPATAQLVFSEQFAGSEIPMDATGPPASDAAPTPKNKETKTKDKPTVTPTTNTMAKSDA